MLVLYARDEERSEWDLMSYTLKTCCNALAVTATGNCCTQTAQTLYLTQCYRVLKSLSDALKESLQKNLQDGRLISEANEAWLDTDANLIEEEMALKHLKGVENLTGAIGSFSEHLKRAVERLVAVESPSGEPDAVKSQI